MEFVGFCGFIKLQFKFVKYSLDKKTIMWKWDRIWDYIHSWWSDRLSSLEEKILSIPRCHWSVAPFRSGSDWQLCLNTSHSSAKHWISESHRVCRYCGGTAASPAKSHKSLGAEIKKRSEKRAKKGKKERKAKEGGGKLARTWHCARVSVRVHDAQ